MTVCKKELPVEVEPSHLFISSSVLKYLMDHKIFSSIMDRVSFWYNLNILLQKSIEIQFQNAQLNHSPLSQATIQTIEGERVLNLSENSHSILGLNQKDFATVLMQDQEEREQTLQQMIKQSGVYAEYYHGLYHWPFNSIWRGFYNKPLEAMQAQMNSGDVIPSFSTSTASLDSQKNEQIEKNGYAFLVRTKGPMLSTGLDLDNHISFYSPLKEIVFSYKTGTDIQESTIDLTQYYQNELNLSYEQVTSYDQSILDLKSEQDIEAYALKMYTLPKSPGLFLNESLSSTLGINQNFMQDTAKIQSWIENNLTGLKADNSQQIELLAHQYVEDYMNKVPGLMMASGNRVLQSLMNKDLLSKAFDPMWKTIGAEVIGLGQSDLKISEDNLAFIIETSIADNIMSKMTAIQNGSSYMEELLLSRIADVQYRYMYNQIPKIQAELVASSAAVTQTSGEIKTTQERLKQLSEDPTSSPEERQEEEQKLNQLIEQETQAEEKISSLKEQSEKMNQDTLNSLKEESSQREQEAADRFPDILK